MKFVIKLVAGLLGVVILLFIAAAIFLVSMVNSDLIKGEISYYALQATGKEISIKGNLQASFYPNLGVKANNVTIANPKGFGTEPLLSANDIVISAKIVPLFKRQFEINRVVLHGANINLRKLADGTTNWQMKEKAQTQTATETKSTAATKQFSIGEIDLRNTNLYYRDDASNKSYALRDLNLTTSAFEENKPLHIKSDFAFWQQNKLVIQTAINTDLIYASKENTVALDKLDLLLTKPDSPKIQLNGAMKLDLTADAIQAKNLKIKTANLTLSGDVTGTNLHKNAHFSGQLQSNTFNLRDALTQFHQPMSFASNRALTKVTFNAKFDADNAAITVSQLLGEIDNQRIKGKFAYQSNNHLLQFKLNTGNIALEDYLPAPAVATKPTASIDETVSSPAESKSANTIIGTLEAEGLRYQKYQFNHLQTEIAYRNQELLLSDLHAAIFGGTLAGSITANFAGNSPTYSINQKLSNIQLDQLLTTIDGKAKLSGLTNLSLNLHASGSGSEMKASLNGSMSMSVSNGVIFGTDMDYKIDQAIVKYTKREAKVNDSGSTRFTTLSANSSINNGVLSTNDLMFLTPKIRVTGTGDVNLNDQNVNIRLTCRLLNPEDIHMNFLGVKINTDLAMYDIPATVGCKISDPCVQVNMTALLTQLAKTQGTKAVEEVVKKGLINKVIKDPKLNETLHKLIPF